ncbi:hypothetical protein CANARDRAFT_176968 [[Candida] arabinofermentans NRRL YB-2248]|uniref:Large ribosomal subunit protein mL67 n=1 Tax=[Candida] arabinofermentans NRRL YB-2248 TaxID=983967 RepID=A0A1E4SY50_9ASCO|nr:hypothetical protein CANARDRAFT_176968 [[Candida] arabinofermentans NRRL YB-2248]
MASKFRNSFWLKENQFAPQVFLFRNIESGQVLYSQLPHLTKYQIKQQTFRPNWENRLPSSRRDIWRPLLIAQFTTYEKAIQAYHGLVELKHMRMNHKRKEANLLRKKNEYHQIWYSGQFRPTYIQESTADLSLIIDEFKLKGTKIYWDGLWFKGGDENWNSDLVSHFEIDRVGGRERFVALDNIVKKVIKLKN